MTERLVRFPGPQGELQGVLSLPEGAGPFPGVVLAHGFASSKRVFRKAARMLAQEGLASLRFDFRGHGESEGVLDGYVFEDVITAVRFLEERPEVESERIGLVGHSMGARAVILALPLVRVRACVALSIGPDASPDGLAYMERFLEELKARQGSTLCVYPGCDALPAPNKFFRQFSLRSMSREGFRLVVDWERSTEAWRVLRVREALAHKGDVPLLYGVCLLDYLTPPAVSRAFYTITPPPRTLRIFPLGFHSSTHKNRWIMRFWIRWLRRHLLSGSPAG